MIRTNLHAPLSAWRAGLLVVTVFTLALSALGAGTVTAGPGTADEIVSANIAASGGDAFAGIENFTSTGKLAIEAPGLGAIEGTIEVVRIPGRGYYENVHIGPIYQQKGWDGEQAWQRGPLGIEMLEGYDALLLAMQSFPNTFVALEQLQPAGLEVTQLDDSELDGRPHYVLEVRTDSTPPVTVYLDGETTLVTRTVSQPSPGEPPVVVDLGGYEFYEGVMMPTSMTIVVEGASKTQLKLDSTVVNTIVDESVFAVPGN